MDINNTNNEEDILLILDMSHVLENDASILHPLVQAEIR